MYSNLLNSWRLRHTTKGRQEMTNQPELSFPTFSLPFTNTKFNSSVGVSSVLLLYDGLTGLVGLVLVPIRNNSNSNGTERFHCRRIALNYPHRTSIVIRPCLWGIQLGELTARADISTDWMGCWFHPSSTSDREWAVIVVSVFVPIVGHAARSLGRSLVTTHFPQFRPLIQWDTDFH